MKVLLAVSLLLVPGPAALAQTTFTYIVFDPPNSTKKYATQINDSGAAVGYYLDATTQLYTGFVRKADDTFSLNLDLSNSNTYTTGINDSGEISGYYFPPDTETTFLLKGGKYSTFDYPGAVTTQINALD
jgi:hypothetical protein